PPGTQNLVWLDGEALCVTQAFREEIGDRLPDWLRFRGPIQNQVEQLEVSLSDGRTGQLVRRFATGLGRLFRSWWRKSAAPEVQHAALLFRLERHGISAPKLLAFGQYRARLWDQYSFLLTLPLEVEGSLVDSLEKSSS